MGSIREDVRRLSRVNRKTPTPQEAALWAVLRGNATGVKFRRQHPFANFILDFYCPAARLAVEVDGAYHVQERDDARDAFVAAADVLTLRFTNDEVDRDIGSVVRRIRASVDERRRR